MDYSAYTPLANSIKPCPFCGGSAQVRMPEESDGFAIHVACRCGAQLYGRARHFSDEAEAAAAWNMRARVE